MKKNEKRPGRIRSAKNKQENSRIERNGEKAGKLLEKYAWSAEETLFLRLLMEVVISFSDAKLLNWGHFDLKRSVLFLDGKEVYLSAETAAALVHFLEEKSEETGIDPQSLITGREVLFSSKTAREIQKSLSQNEI